MLITWRIGLQDSPAIITYKTIGGYIHSNISTIYTQINTSYGTPLIPTEILLSSNTCRRREIWLGWEGCLQITTVYVICLLANACIHYPCGSYPSIVHVVNYQASRSVEPGDKLLELQPRHVALRRGHPLPQAKSTSLISYLSVPQFGSPCLRTLLHMHMHRYLVIVVSQNDCRCHSC